MLGLDLLEGETFISGLVDAAPSHGGAAQAGNGVRRYLRQVAIYASSPSVLRGKMLCLATPYDSRQITERVLDNERASGRAQISVASTCLSLTC